VMWPQPAQAPSDPHHWVWCPFEHLAWWCPCEHQGRLVAFSRQWTGWKTCNLMMMMMCGAQGAYLIQGRLKLSDLKGCDM